MTIFAPSKLVLPGSPGTDGLVGLWDPSIQGAGGTKLPDLSGQGNHGTIGGGVWVTSETGRGILLEESEDDYITIEPGRNLLPGGWGPYTIMYWGHIPGTSVNDWTLFALGDTATAAAGQEVWQSHAANYRFLLKSFNNASSYVTSNHTSGRIQIALVYESATSRKLYVDGELLITDTDSVTPSNNPNTLRIGCQAKAGYTSASSDHDAVDQFALWSRALTAAEILSLCDNPDHIFRREPIELWGAVLVSGGGTAQALAGTIAAQAAVSGSMVLAASLAGSAAAVSAVSAAISVGMGISGLIAGTTALTGRVAVVRGTSGAIAAVTAVSGGLTITRSIQGALTSQSAVSGALSTDKKLVGAITSQSVVTGSLSVGKKVQGSIASQSAVIASLSTDKKLTGTVTSQSAVSGALSTDKKLTGTVTSQSVVTGSISTDKKLVGAITSQSVVTGSLSVGKKVQGALTSQSVVSGSLSTDKKLTGTVTSQSAVTGALTIKGSVELQGSTAAQSVVTGSLSVGKKVQGSIAAQSVVSGSLSTDKKLVGAITSQSAVTGALTIKGSVELRGSAAAQSVVSGSLSTDKKLTGTVTSQSVVSGSLTIKGSVELRGSTAAQSVVSGSLSVGRTLAGVTAAQSVVTGTLTVEEMLVTLQGSISAQSAVTCSISIAREVQGIVVAQSVVTGTLSRVVSLKGSLAATSSLSANLSTLLIELVGSIAAQSAVTGALGVESAPVISAGTIPQSTILAAYLKAQDLFSDPSEDDDWPVFTRRFPEASDVSNNLGCLYDTAGVVDGKGMRGNVNERHGIQFRIRGVGYNTTSSKLASTLDNLKAVTGETVTVESRVFKIHNIQRATTVHHLKRDQKRRDHFVTDLLLAYSEL